ncbi:MAG: deoxyribodipyrimidine photo-lyase, partial [Pseudohongiellaceae bacterium]
CMRLDRFCLQGLDAYHKLRDQPALDATSRLSPYLAAGVLGIRECWRKSAACQDGEGLFTWQNELLWRDFYRHIMFHFPRVCQHQPWKQDTVRIPWRHDPKEFHRWCHGQTGFPIIDAAMRQLLELGWMHNRLRMIVAMFLSKHLLIDWRLGEKWFMQHLVDGDFAANNGGWQWSASTGTDAVPYFRIFNPVTQSQRFDPHGDFIRAFVPELATLDRRAIHQPGKLRPAAYPEPMIDLGFGRQRALSAFKNHRLE